MKIKEKISVIYPVSQHTNFADYVKKSIPPSPDITLRVDELPKSIDIKAIIGTHLKYEPGVNYHIRGFVKDENGDLVTSENGESSSKTGSVYFNIDLQDGMVSYLCDYTFLNLYIKSEGMYQLEISLYSGFIEDNPTSQGKIHSNSSYLLVTKNSNDEVSNG
ncbi:hypothetical protein V6858_003966 [Providencia rettgeri]